MRRGRKCVFISRTELKGCTQAVKSIARAAWKSSSLTIYIWILDSGTQLSSECCVCALSLLFSMKKKEKWAASWPASHLPTRPSWDEQGKKSVRESEVINCRHGIILFRILALKVTTQRERHESWMSQREQRQQNKKGCCSMKISSEEFNVEGWDKKSFRLNPKVFATVTLDFFFA